MNTESAVYECMHACRLCMYAYTYMVCLVKTMHTNSTHSCVNRYPLVVAIKKCQEPIINALVEICSPELHLTDNFSQLFVHHYNVVMSIARTCGLHILATHAKGKFEQKNSNSKFFYSRKQAIMVSKF